MTNSATLTPSGTAHILLDDRGRGWIDDSGTKVIEVVLDHIGPDRMSAEEIHTQRPHLTLDQIRAALGYYAANRSTIDREILSANEEYRKLREKTENTHKQAELHQLKLQREAKQEEMGFQTCTSCGATVPKSAYCPECGHSLSKWCPKCGEWKAATYRDVEIDQLGVGGLGVLIADSEREAKFCPDCGTALQVKRAAHE